jgi:hypothetical protein
MKSVSTCDLIALERPLGDPPFGLGVVDDLPERVLGHHRDGVRIEVVSKLALGHQDRAHKILHLGVTRLGVGEYLADKVHNSLHFLRPSGLFSLDHQRCTDHLSCR